MRRGWDPFDVLPRRGGAALEGGRKLLERFGGKVPEV